MGKSKYLAILAKIGRQSHPPLLPQGEGVKKVTQAKTEEMKLKLAAHQANSALKEFQIKNSGKETRAPKLASSRAKTPSKPKGA